MKYANCHIYGCSIKAETFGTTRKAHNDITFYPRYVVLPKGGYPCGTTCTECYKTTEDE